MRTTNYFILTLLLISSFELLGQALTVSVSKDSILLGNQFKLVYDLENLDGDISDPYLENCRVIGPNISSQYQNINGNITQKKSYTYFITPLTEGTLIIDSVSLSTADKSITSEPINIIVSPNPEGIIEQDNLQKNDFFNFNFDSPFDKPKIEKTHPNLSNRKRRKI